MNASGNDRLDLATVNGMMNLCEAREQTRLDEAAAITEPEQRKAAYARRLKEFYAKEGVAISEETIQNAVAEYLENELTFQPPKGGLAGVFATLYVHRAWVTMLTALVLFVTVSLGIIQAEVRDNARKAAWQQATAAASRLEEEIRSTQEAIAGSEQAHQLNTQNRAARLTAKALPELLRNPQAELDQSAGKNFTMAEHALTLANEAAGGCRSQAAGAGNYRAKSTAEWNRLDGVASQAKEKIEAQLAVAGSALGAVAEIQNRQDTLDNLGRLWLTLNEQLPATPQKWRSAAQASLDAGAAKLTQGDATADGALAEARRLITDGARWAPLELACRTELQVSRACQTRDAGTQQVLNDAQTVLQQALDEQDLKNATQSLQQLKSTLAQINQFYEIRIVCRTGYRTVVERTEHNSRAKRYYAIVESVDHNGNALNRRIKNREIGTFLETSMWGQEIPEKLYQDLYHEKATTGAIQDLSFGEKEPGYLEPRFDKAPGSNHEITRW